MKKLSLFYATNRKHQGSNRWSPESYGRQFSEDGMENLRFGKVELSATQTTIDKYLARRIPSGGTGQGVDLATYLTERAEKSASLMAYPEEIDSEIAERSQETRLGSLAMFADLQEAMNRASDVLVYIHGFNVAWNEAVGSALALQLMLNKKRRATDSDRQSPAKDILVVLFSWPSDGLMLPWVSYKSDRSEARGSGAAVARAMLKMRDYLMDLRDLSKRSNVEVCNQQIHLLCHSMGNYLLEKVVRRMRRFTPGSTLPRLFDHIFLCAADVDDNTLEPGEPLGRLHQLGRNVTLYHNQNDKAMVISDYSKGQPERLGGSGAARPQQLHAKVQQVDCMTVASGKVQHSYYLNGFTAADIRQSIDGVAAEAKSRRRERIGRLDNVWRLG